MPKANNTEIYNYDEYPSLKDYLFGTDFENQKKNKSYRLNSIIGLINGVNGINNLQYIFSNGSSLDIDYYKKGYFFTDTNETNPLNFTKLVINKETIRPVDLSLLFERLSELNNLVLKIDNPEDPRNFFNFIVKSIDNQSEFFVFDIEILGDFYFGELQNNKIYSFYFDRKEYFSGKLDKGSYEGNAEDLDERISILEAKAPSNVFKFIQKGYGNEDLVYVEIGDIFCGFSNDGTIRISEGEWLGGELTDSTNFKPMVQTIRE